ncbi:tRNA (adenosine(37)-N6)-threonylcarbamoyltransferase complex dimerization subunit type 1 TsaB [Bacillus solitudinis]|uniref:tRNA (adenosine(37)-N6)-threonylcarbamoyltransferase complex dimerization subunit type 1 TsaB n=1 Tax=Bacillus solitudinis TaxID=2014074 RepID=UPI000C24F242|nr:tRNA (adenosine(37)-N6)-threonylcarbamoyltransferase complex dimerization subunit type 1 TsaB [Bacillus solitudinis]
MSKTLAIDTSSFVMGIAVIDGKRVLGEVITNIKKNHSIRLMPAITELMNEVDVKPVDLTKIVVASGPGSYTGVRIGVTTAKTLAWSLNIPIVGVSSLEVMAQSGFYFQGMASPLVDARRGQVYTGLYKNGDTMMNDQLILLDDWLTILEATEGEILFIGQDVDLHRDMIEERLGNRANFALESMVLPRPSELARLGLTKEEETSIHTFVPKYLQLAEAEAKWLKTEEEKREKQ